MLHLEMQNNLGILDDDNQKRTRKNTPEKRLENWEPRWQSKKLNFHLSDKKCFSSFNSIILSQDFLYRCFINRNLTV